MNKILEFLKSFFSSSPDPVIKPGQFSLGAILNEPDNRDIPYAAVGTPVAVYPPQLTVPNFFTTERLLQGSLGTCVSHAIEFIKRSIDGIRHSRRAFYTIVRNAIGWTEAQGQGLPQREAAKAATIVGLPKDNGQDDNTLSHSVYDSLPITQAMRDEANIYKFSGFAFPFISELGFKQALADGKMIAVTMAIDWSAIDPDGTVHPVKNALAGFHEAVIGEWDNTIRKFRFANWWGPWGTQGDGYISYTELALVARDAIAFTDIPEDLKIRAKAMQFIFTTDMKIGDKNASVAQLQKRLGAYGVLSGLPDGDFGPKTMQAVKDYQRFKGLAQDGRVGPATRLSLNNDSGNVAGVKSAIDLWCDAAKDMEGAKPYRNNPGNLRYVGQQYAVNDAGFCKFDTYAHGYAALRNLFVQACSGLSHLYNANGSLYDFYKVYAPESDGNDPKHYAEFVAKRIGVDPAVSIKTLLF